MGRRIEGKIAVFISGPLRYVTLVNQRLDEVLNDCEYDCFYHLWQADLGNKVRQGGDCDYRILEKHPRTKVLMLQSPYSEESFADTIGTQTGSNSTINATMGMFYSVSVLCNILRHLPDYHSYKYILRLRTDCAILNDDFVSLLDPDPEVLTLAKSYFIPQGRLCDHICFSTVENFFRLWCYRDMEEIYQAYRMGERNPEITLSNRLKQQLPNVRLNPSIVRFRDYHIVYFPPRDCEPKCITSTLNNVDMKEFFLNPAHYIDLAEIERFNTQWKTKWENLDKEKNKNELIAKKESSIYSLFEDSTGQVKISFVMIVLNGMPFIEYSLRSIYDYAHEIIIVEGAVENCMFAANPDGSSKDGTVEFIRSFPDRYSKIKLIRGWWPEKCEMQNEALKHVTGDYVWLIDSDEVYKQQDVEKVKQILTSDPTITQVNFIPDNFWKGLDYIFVSPKFFTESHHYRRIFKYKPGATFTSHRPPTMIWPGSTKTTEQMNLLDGLKTRQMKIIPYHYSYVLDEQVKQKIELYRTYGFDKRWKIDLVKWYNEFFLKWTPENRQEIEKKYPVWTGDKNSRTQVFTDSHPQVIQDFRRKLSEKVCSDGRKAKSVRIAEHYVKDGRSIDSQSSFGKKISELFAEIRPKKVIETGTHLGTGTTTIIDRALKNLSIEDTVFFTIEVNPQYYARARKYFEINNIKVHALNGLSVPSSMLPSKYDISQKTIKDVDYDGVFVDHEEKDRVELYYNETNFPDLPDNLLYKCLEKFNFKPDFVLLDSGGHMGNIEFNYLIENLQGECYIALDDIYHVKHARSFQQIKNDKRFDIVSCSDEKYGFCIAKFTPVSERANTETSIHVSPIRQRINHPKKVLIVRSDSVGDFVIFGGAITYYKKLYPDAHLSIVVSENVARLAEICPYFDEVITFNRRRMCLESEYAAWFINEINSKKYDVVICPAFSRDKVSEFIAINCNSPEKITSSGDTANLPKEVIDANNSRYTKVLSMAEGINLETVRNKEFLKGLGIELDAPYVPTIWITKDDRLSAMNILKERGIRNPIIIAPFAQHSIRNWSIDNWANLISHYSHIPVVICGLERDKVDAERIAKTSKHSNIHNFCGMTTLLQLAALIEQSRLCISSESAVAHFAAVARRPHVVLIGGGHFERFMPYSNHTYLVYNRMDCFNCNWQCIYEGDIRCINSISVEQVRDAVDNILDGLQFHTTVIPQCGEHKYLVSAIVSTYNSEKFIRGCLEDLEDQTIADRLEIIVVNSGSQQNEYAIVKEFQQKYSNIKYIKTDQRETVYQAWNRAIKTATGEYITNANTDDRHRANALEVMVNTLQGNPEIALVYGDQIRTDIPNDNFENNHGTEKLARSEYSRERLLFGCCTGSQTMWRKSLHSEFGYFDETLTTAADWDFWLRISEKYELKKIPEFLGLYYHNEDGIEHGGKIHSLYERYLVGKRYGTPYISVIPLYTNKDNPLISIVMPAYNSEKYIKKAIESVLIQNYRNFELIVVDDGSTDNTRDIVSVFNDEKIKYYYQENGGASSARNHAIKKSRGDFVVILDSDDMVTPDFISRHLQEYEQHPNADLVYCDDCLIDENDKPVRVIERPEYSDRKILIRDLFRCGFPVVPFRTCIKKDVFDRIGLFDEELMVGEDYDMMRRFAKHGLKLHHLKGPLYLRRMNNNSLSKTFSAQKAKNHFDVVKRFAETFAYDELFPDINWEKIAYERRNVNVKCLAAETYLAIGQDYVETNSPPIYAETAFDQAYSELKECLNLDPDNRLIQQLLRKYESRRRNFEELIQQKI